ncbi:hypothetical protein [Candidatus Poriferisodalis sp.]|uniref:hypothetical protein n=1 Tax=Candidatus Poriferisodalis sp. TaxID=3101277 RepID=UPI003B02D694
MNIHPAFHEAAQPTIHRTARRSARHAVPVHRSAPVRRTHRLQSTADESGQTTAEYALLTGAIALVVAAVTAWATTTGKIGRLLDSVFNYLVKAVS